MNRRSATYATLLLAHKWWIIASTLLAGLAAALMSLTLEDQFQARARLLVLEPTVESKAGGYTNVNNTVYTVDTYSSMLANQELLAGAVRDLGLDFPPDRLSGSRLLGRLSIVPVKDTKLIELSVVYSNAAKTRIIVNKIANRFVDLYQNIRTNEINSSQRFIQEQLDMARFAYDIAQDSLRIARSAGRVDELHLRLQNIMEQIKLFQIDLEASRGDLSRMNARLAEVDQLLGDLPEETMASRREFTTILHGQPAGASAAEDVSTLLHDIDLSALSRQTANEEQKAQIQRAIQQLNDLRAAARDLENPPGRRRLTPQEWADRLGILASGLRDLERSMAEMTASFGRQASSLSPLTLRVGALASSISGQVAQQTTEQQMQANPLRTTLLREQAEDRMRRQGLAAKIEHLEHVLTGLRKELVSVEQGLYRGMRNVESMEQESKSLADLKSFLTEKYDQSRIEVAAKLGTMILVDPALIPERKIGPQRKLNVLLGLLVGFSVGSLFVVGKELFQATESA